MVILEPRSDSPCLPLAHSSSHTHPPTTEVSMETTLSGQAKDYSFVTDGEARGRGTYAHIGEKIEKIDSVRNTHTYTLAHMAQR